MTIGIGKRDDDVESSGKASRKTSTPAEYPAESTCGLGIRHLQTLLMFLGVTLAYSQRVGMSVAIIPMINASTANLNFEDYGWDNKEKSLVLSSFFWGYAVAQMPSGYIAGIWSAQMLLSIGMLLAGVFNIIAPFATHQWNLVAICTCRVGMGFTQGCLLPCVHTLLSKWAPPSERARLGTFAYAGAQFGTVIALPICGALAASATGWPGIFYLFGALGILWSICFFLLGADSPSKHRSISQEERVYIEESLKTSEKLEKNKVGQKLQTPWRQILTSKPMWALIIAHGGQNWGYWTLLTEMPTYMKKVLGFDIEGTGGYSALPYLAMWMLSFPASWLSDFTLEKGVSRGLVRKVSNTVAFWCPAIALMCMSAIPTDNSVYALILLIIAVGLNAGSLCGFQVNHIDLSPNYAGNMISITNTVGSVVAIVAPIVTEQTIISDETNVSQWNIVFYVSAAIYFLSNLVFVIFGAGEVQWWNEPEKVKAWQQQRIRKDDVIEMQTCLSVRLSAREWERLISVMEYKATWVRSANRSRSYYSRRTSLRQEVDRRMASSFRKKRVSVISLSERMKVPPNRPKAWYGCRHTQVLLMCFCFLCCYAIRVTMSVAVEAMTNAKTANPNFEEFTWEESEKRLILSSFFWGYICTQIPGSMIARQWSASKLFALALIVCGLTTIVVPVTAHYGGWQAVCTARVFAGFAQGTILPTIHTLLSRWVPTDERGRLGMFVYSGGWIGNVISLLSSGYLSASPIGWPSCFYVWGSICILCGVAFYLIGKDSPSEHPSIPLDEKEYIEISLGVTEITEKPPTPWISILTSVPVWALLVTQCAQNWGFWMLLTEIPSYMTSIMNFDIKENGLWTALPYLTAWISSFPISYVSDLCIKRNIVTTEASRKICNTFSQVVPALALIGLGYVNSDQPALAETILVIAVSTNIASYCGYNVNHMDLSPNFAGTLMGFTNAAANICSLLAPIVAGWIAPNTKDILQWRNVFFLSAAIYIVGALMFALFGTTKIQRWNDEVQSRRDSVLDNISKAPMAVATIEELKDIEKIP
ncbi:LOW QUALITY PROTEIN: uncharacterized protein LOC116850093 [Odontomachus brunneus]|uniref:LOW QUALITY PROTEIN: uncharacterized protein LOC116850093 n=1 Tax=Odontomachus brunneus TaxID=486640 RepID=UPI0013F1C516|nr:LOW QUALITY PROTEIN: uncharacterized protein LOC116850093 [Odontomachus brunneus]